MAKSVTDVIKKTGKTDGKSNKLGKGGRFKQMENKGLSDKLIAWIGKSNHSSKKMSQWSSSERESKK